MHFDRFEKIPFNIYGYFDTKQPSLSKKTIIFQRFNVSAQK